MSFSDDLLSGGARLADELRLPSGGLLDEGGTAQGGTFGGLSFGSGPPGTTLRQFDSPGGTSAVDELPGQPAGDDLPPLASGDELPLQTGRQAEEALGLDETTTVQEEQFDELQLEGQVDLGEDFQTVSDDLGARNVDEASQSAVDEAISAIDEQVDNALGGTSDESGTLFVGSTQDEVDEAIAGIRSSSDEATAGPGRTDTSVFGAPSSADETARVGDDTSRFFDEGDEASSGSRIDDSASTGDELVSGGDEATTTNDDSGGFLSRLFGGKRGVAAGVTLGAGGAALVGMGGLNSVLTGSNGTSWRYEEVTTFRGGDGAVVFEVFNGDKSTGYAVLVAGFPRTKALQPDGTVVDAALTKQELSNKRALQEAHQNGRHLEGVFGSVKGARNAWNKFLEQNPGQREGPGGANSQKWSGTVEVPSSSPQGEKWSATAALKNATNREMSAVFALGVVREGSFVIISDTKRETVAPSGGKTLRWESVNKSNRLPAGSETIRFAAIRGDGVGTISKTTIEITGGQGQDGSGSGTGSSKWGNTEVVGELAAGWYLVRQQKKDGSDERFFVAGKTSDGQRIYLHPDARTKQEPYPYDSRQRAVQAVKTWLQAKQNGNASGPSPSPSAGRPNPDKVRNDAAEQGGLLGTLGGLVDAATRNPILLVGVVGGGAALWYYSDGEPIDWASQQLSDLSGTIGNAVGGS